MEEIYIFKDENKWELTNPLSFATEQGFLEIFQQTYWRLVSCSHKMAPNN